MKWTRMLFPAWITASTVWVAYAGYAMWSVKRLPLPPPAPNETTYVVELSVLHQSINILSNVAVPPLLVLFLGWGLLRILPRP